MIEQTGASGAKTVYTYDERNRNTSVTDALGHRTSFVYDEASRLVNRTDAKGNKTSYEYDDIEMSSRLRNILRRNGFKSLEGLREYPKEHFIKFSNMGQATLQELYQICEE